MVVLRSLSRLRLFSKIFVGHRPSAGSRRIKSRVLLIGQIHWLFISYSLGKSSVADLLAMI